jgi:coenzyme F420-reducing hydrogenase beta subunit
VVEYITGVLCVVVFEYRKIVEVVLTDTELRKDVVVGEQEETGGVWVKLEEYHLSVFLV